ncbi:MAG: PLxRFG domain-containing protein, partial [Nitrospirota bacterium]|nr:PLxRFG domain-containing protein [Nitrospirota bacterium]
APPAPPVVQAPPAPPVVQAPPAPTVVQAPPAPPVVQAPPAPPVVQAPPAPRRAAGIASILSDETGAVDFDKLLGIFAIRKAVQEDAARIRDMFKKATPPEGVRIEEPKTSRDIDYIRRMLWTPRAAWARNPSLAALQRFGEKIETALSAANTRLQKEFNAIRNGMSAPDWEKLTDIIWMGDADAVVFDNPELLEMTGGSLPIVNGYRKFRRYIDKVGRLVDQHNRSMQTTRQNRKMALLKRMGTMRNMDDPEFRTLYGKRARLRARLRAGKGNPDELAQQLDQIEDLLQMKRGETDEFSALMKELDQLDAALGRGTVRRRVGYAPHKFFGTWAAYRLGERDVLDADGQPTGEKQETHTLVAGEHGFFASQEEAVAAARGVMEADPNTKLMVRPVQFAFPNSEATTLSDASYWRLLGTVGKELELKGPELADAMKGIARRRFRRRIAGFAQFRSGVAGYSKDLDRVMRTHIGEAIRYVYLDKLKHRAINDIERLGLSPARSASNNPTLTAMVNAWLRDVNGQKQPMETSIDEVLDRPWARPSMVAAGAAATVSAPLFLGMASNPLVGMLLGSYVGARAYGALRDAHGFKTRALTGAMISDMSHLKLGMFFNLGSAVVNLTQTVINTLPVLGPEYTMQGVTLLGRALSSRLRGDPNRYYRLLERADIVSNFRHAEVGAHQFDAEDNAARLSLFFFNKAEQFNRAVVFLGAYEKAKAAGSSEAKAFRVASRTMLFTQHHYGPSNKPEAMRNTLLRVPAQFKNFLAQQLAFTWELGRTSLTGQNLTGVPMDPKTALPLHLTSLFLVAGTLGLPFVGLLDVLLDSLFDFSPIEELKKLALEMQAKGELAGMATNVVVRGMPSIAGEEMSARVGEGDKFFPHDLRDLKGPWWSTIGNARALGEMNAGAVDQLKNLSGGVGKPLKSLEAAANGLPMSDAIRDPRRWFEALADDRIDYTSPWLNGYTEWDETMLTRTDLARMAVGSTPLVVSQARDVADISDRMKNRQKARTKRFASEVTISIRRYEKEPDQLAAELNRIADDMAKEGVVSPQVFHRAVRDAFTPRVQRIVRQTRVVLRPEIAALVEPLVDEGAP